MKSIVVVIMAGGLGKRMESSLPKVLHKIDGIPMICHLLLNLKFMQNASINKCIQSKIMSEMELYFSEKHYIKIEKIIIVVGKYKDIIKTEIEKYVQMLEIKYVVQEEPLGTGHAVKCCINELSEFPDSDILILSGDVPLLQPDTMDKLITMYEPVKIITTKLNDSTGYGRVIKINKKFDKIVEQKDCNKEELKVNEINGGIYAIKSKYLCKHLPNLQNNNSQKEYYLTDIVEIIKREEKLDIGILQIPKKNVHEILGVNTIEQLKELEKLIENKIENKKHIQK